MSSSSPPSPSPGIPCLRAGMAGMGMIFEETYAPFFAAAARGLFDPECGVFAVSLTGAATRTGRRAEA